MAIAKNPNCAQCEKDMPRYYLTIWRQPDDPPKAGQLLRDASTPSKLDDVWGSIVRVVGEVTSTYATMANAKRGQRCWKVWTGCYRGYDPFCTLRCALAYARTCYKLHGRQSSRPAVRF